MADKQLPTRSALRSNLRFRQTERCFEAVTSHMQNVMGNLLSTYEIHTYSTYRIRISFVISNWN